MLLRYISAEIAKVIAKKLFGAALIGGIKGFVVKHLTEIVIKRVVAPLIKLINDQFQTIIDKIKTKKAVKELENAKTKDEVKKAFDNLP